MKTLTIVNSTELAKALVAVEAPEQAVPVGETADTVGGTAEVTPAPDYTISPARYAKGMMAVRCPSPDGYKTRASRLIGDGLNSRHTGRENAYIVSPATAATFESMYRAGWDACIISGTLEPPTPRAWTYDTGFAQWLKGKVGGDWCVARRSTKRLALRYSTILKPREYDAFRGQFEAECAGVEYHAAPSKGKPHAKPHGKLQFIDALHETAPTDKYGWSRHLIGPYELSTNGTAWAATMTATGRDCRSLAAVMKMAARIKRIAGNATVPPAPSADEAPPVGEMVEAPPLQPSIEDMATAGEMTEGAKLDPHTAAHLDALDQAERIDALADLLARYEPATRAAAASRRLGRPVDITASPREMAKMILADEATLERVAA